MRQSVMKPHLQRVWNPRTETFPSWVDQSGGLFSALIARLLFLRGMETRQQAESFVGARLKDLPDPFLLRGMESAVERLVRAIRSGEQIAVHGDYDVDGISATALLCQALRGFGAQVQYHIPLRMRDGYGLSAEALRQAAAAGTAVVVSVDCGISAHEEAALARTLQLDLIITDHHQPPQQLPDALACVNPWLSPDFPFQPLAGVGVAFMLVIGLNSRLRREGLLPQPVPDIRCLLDLVALGTVADLVSLTGVNRLLVRVGLELMQQGGRPGLECLRQVAQMEEVSSSGVGFKLAPRLNAAGRLQDGASGVELLLTADPGQARRIAKELDDWNQQRRQIERETFEQALERISAELDGQQRTIVLADERWHAGVIGIVASRLVEQFHRPVVLVALDSETGQGKGSARSIRGFHLYDALCGCGGHLLAYGGHACAAGLTLAIDQVTAFAQAFESLAGERLTPEQLQPQRRYDLEVGLEQLDENLYRQLQQLAPFGMDNPEPLFLIRRVRPQQLKQVGQQHARFMAAQNNGCLPCIAFGVGERFSQLTGEVDLLAHLTLNRWQGRETLQLQIRDFRCAE